MTSTLVSVEVRAILKININMNVIVIVNKFFKILYFNRYKYKIVSPNISRNNLSKSLKVLIKLKL